MSAKWMVSVFGVGMLLVAATPGAAHHSFSAVFDGNKPITLKGTIARMLWSNPHGHLYIDVKNASGEVLTWEIETSSPTALLRRGWRKEDLPVGKEVIVKGYLAKDGTPTLNASSVTVVDTGKELFDGTGGQ